MRTNACNCFRVMFPNPASRYPIKKYNYLVPGIFPITPPNIDEDLDSSVTNKIKKLQEYVSKNPQRVAKVNLLILSRI